jgi:hypothetical protein
LAPEVLKTNYVGHNLNFKVQVPKGTSLVKVFEILSRNGSWAENAFIVFSRYDLVQKSVVRFILG